jgi:hypothetical protein
MTEPADISRAIGSGAIMYRDFNDLKVQFSGAKDKIEVTEGIEVAKVTPVRGNLFVIGAKEDLGSTKRIFEALV